MDDFSVLCLPAVLIGLIPAEIARSKGHNFWAWWVFGTALFILALPAALLLSRNEEEIEHRSLQTGNHKKCPYCAEIVRAEAVVCKHCGRDIPLTLIQSHQDQASHYASNITTLQDGYLSLTRTHLRYKSAVYPLQQIRAVSATQSPGGYEVIRVTDVSGKNRDFGFWKDRREAVRWAQAINRNQQAMAGLLRDDQPMPTEQIVKDASVAPQELPT